MSSAGRDGSLRTGGQGPRQEHGRSDGSHLPAKLVSQLRGTAFGRNILVSLDNQHTHAHTTSARRFESLPAQLLCQILEPWSIETPARPARIQLLLPCDRCCCSCSTDTALPSAVPQRRLLLPALRCAALLPGLTAHPTPQYSSAPAPRLAPRTRALHQLHLSFQQHGQCVSVAFCYQT